MLGLSDAGRVLRDFATYLPTQAVPALVGFLVLPVLTRKLEPTGLGVLAITQTLVSLGWTVTGSWLVAAVIRELPAHRARNDVPGFTRTLRRSLGLVAVGLTVFAGLMAVAAVGSTAIADNFGLVLAAAAGLVVQNIAVSLFAAGLRPRSYAAVEITARVGGIGLGVALVFAGYDVAGYLAGIAASSFVVGLVGLWFAWPRERGTPAGAPEVRSWLHYGVPVSAAATLGWFLAFIDRYILAFLRDEAAVGIYTMGNVLGDRLVMVPVMAFAAATGPLLVTAFERHGRPEVERLLTVYSRVILLVALPCVALIAATGPDLVTLIAGINYFRYGEAATVAPIVACGSVMIALAGLANIGLAVSKQTRYAAASTAIGLALNIAFNLLLIPVWGIIGAAIATPLGNAAYLAATCYWSRRYVTWRFPWGTFVRTCLAAGACYAVAVSIPLGKLPLERIVLMVIAGMGTYLGALLVLGERRKFMPGRAATAPGPARRAATSR
jgi:O-antigen/teichoic acid export membrane protein